MNLKEAALTVYKKKYATFKGRATRSEFWYGALAYALVIAVLGIALMLIGGGFEDPNTLGVVFLSAYAVVSLFSIIPIFAVCVRRLHDLGRSGWWMLLFVGANLIPIVGLLVTVGFYIWFAFRGTKGENKFGPDPLIMGTENAAE